jgi:hypothetical protein
MTGEPGGAAATEPIRPLRTDDEKALVEALARGAVTDVAPQELPLFRSTSQAYFEDPRRVRGEPASADDMLGFGAELGAAVVFVTPVALEVARSVVSFVGSQLETAFKEEAGPRIRAIVQRILGSKPGTPAGGATAEPGEAKGEAQKAEAQKADAEAEADEVLSREQLSEVHEVALRTARRLKLPPDRAATLADAIVGRLAA